MDNTLQKRLTAVCICVLCDNDTSLNGGSYVSLLLDFIPTAREARPLYNDFSSSQSKARCLALSVVRSPSINTTGRLPTWAKFRPRAAAVDLEGSNPSYSSRPASFHRNSISVDLPVPGSPTISRKGNDLSRSRICSANSDPSQKASATYPFSPNAIQISSIQLVVNSFSFGFRSSDGVRLRLLHWRD